MMTSPRTVMIAAMGLFCAGSLLFAVPVSAATCPSDSTQNNPQTQDIVDQIKDHTESDFRDEINDHVTDEFEKHRKWMMDDLWLKNILPAMMAMTEQLSAVALQQFSIIGTFIDAKHQLETQRLFQEMAAQTQKDYNPNEELCTIGTAIRSLATSEQNSKITAMQLARHSLARQTLNANMNSSEGPREDLEGRIEHFRRLYCDKNDNNKGLGSICGSSVPQERRNKDIDFGRTLGLADTLDVDFSNTDLTADEEDLLALSSNLYSHKVFAPLPEAQMKGSNTLQERYLQQRSVIAQRSVAEASYQAIAAMKTKGTNTTDSTLYLQSALEGLGIPNEEAQVIIGQNPSYYAQMGILTKTIFQRPEFFVALYDRPTNIARRGVALQGIALMQKRDLFQSALRSEAMISILLELELQEAQDKVQNNLNSLTNTVN